MPLILTILMLFAFTTPGATASRESRLHSAGYTNETDSVARTQIHEELRGYYRDLQDRNWTSMVTHFYPAKVTARFAAPEDDPAWIALNVPPIRAHEIPRANGYCLPNASIAIVGHWARVLARRCTGETDEAWFYSMSGRWKIIHLDSQRSATTAAREEQRL